MNFMRRMLLVFLFLLASMPIAAVAASGDELVLKLQEIVPEEPAVATAEHGKIMADAGSTKRLDAAVLLIQALAFNFEPGSSNESLSLVEMMPAATILKRQYGVSVLPLLMVEAVSTEKEWLRGRIALVVKSLGSQQEIAKIVDIFSLKVSADSKARRFFAILEQDKIDIELANPNLESAKKFIEGLKKEKKPPVR